MSSFTNLFEISSENELKSYLQQAKKRHVLFFWAPWHEASKQGGQLHQIIQQLANKYNNISFYTVEAEAQATISEKFQISVVPTFLFLVGNKIVSKVEGFNPSELNIQVKELASRLENEEGDETGASNQASLNERLKSLVESSEVMLFMKGSPSAPRCGFSRKMIDLLVNQGITFGSFDILTDEEVRSGLKVLYDWPTYPQLYVRGNLIGGLDIVTEMAANGPLRPQLGLPDVSASNSASSAEDLNDKLKRLINSAPVMLFMKGTPDAPRCGFSRSIVDILKSEGVEFGSFDILSDEDVRQGLKTYSDWPTYPQLYSKGLLIGGLDIVKEMQQSGPLKPQL